MAEKANFSSPEGFAQACGILMVDLQIAEGFHRDKTQLAGRLQARLWHQLGEGVGSYPRFKASPRFDLWKRFLDELQEPLGQNLQEILERFAGWGYR